METLKENTCTLSNDELCNKIDSFITELCMTGGKSLSLSVPVNFNRDPDVLISELIKRFKAFELGKAEDKLIGIDKSDIDFIVDNALNGLWNLCEEKLKLKLGDIETRNLIECRDRCKSIMKKLDPTLF